MARNKKVFQAGDELEINLNGAWVPAVVRLVHPAVKEVNKPVTLTVRTTDAQTKVIQGVPVGSTREVGASTDGAPVSTGGSANTTPEVGPGSVTAVDGSVTSGADAVAQANATQEAAAAAPAEEESAAEDAQEGAEETAPVETAPTETPAPAEDTSSSTVADSQPAADSGSPAPTDASSADAAASTGNATADAPAADGQSLSN